MPPTPDDFGANPRRAKNKIESVTISVRNAKSSHGVETATVSNAARDCRRSLMPQDNGQFEGVSSRSGGRGGKGGVTRPPARSELYV